MIGLIMKETTIPAQFLKTFLHLAKTRSFVGTARQLHMTQPGVSQHLRHLEDFYKVTLASRKGKSFQLTDAGKTLQAYCETLFKDHDDLLTHLSIDDPYKGICKISSPGSVGMIIYDTLLKHNLVNKNLSIEFTAAPNQDVIDGVLTGRVDLGFVSKPNVDDKIFCEKFASERLLLLTPCGRNCRSFKDLINLGFISHPDGPYYLSRILEVNFPDDLKSMKHIPIKGRINQLTRILDPVALGLGFTVLPEFVMAFYPAHKQISITPLKIEVQDSIYRINLANKILPARYIKILELLHHAVHSQNS
jgi:DNA-binding transcriptional LysR family regulator